MSLNCLYLVCKASVNIIWMVVINDVLKAHVTATTCGLLLPYHRPTCCPSSSALLQWVVVLVAVAFLTA